MSTQGLLLLGGVLFVVGLTLVATRRNAILALMGVELMLNAANLNFVAFQRQHPESPEGSVAAVVVMALAAAEAAVALSLVLNVYRRYKTVDLDALDELRG